MTAANREPVPVRIAHRGQTLTIETAWVGPTRPEQTGPTWVFLHEGLGSVSLWKDFPERLCNALGQPGLVYSRPGHGRSPLCPLTVRPGPGHLHREALEVLPAVLAAVGIDSLAHPVWLFGHSDGGSIALIHAARHRERVAGMVVLAPHIHVEAISLASIGRAAEDWNLGRLQAGLARHHADPAAAFGLWSGTWLDPAFADWSLAADLESIACPVLAIQGEDDHYGTMAQIRGIAAAVPETELLELARCGHSPHRDQPEAVIAAVGRFVGRPRARPTV